MSRKKTRKKKPKVDLREIKLEELKAIIDKAKTASLSEEEGEKLLAAVETLAFLTNELEKKGVSINRLRQLLFGASTEKTSQVFKDTGENTGSAPGSAPGDVEGKESKEKKKRKGHGRNGASDYKGAEKIKIPHESLHSGDPCPGCERGKVYLQNEPGVIVRVKGMAPLSATVYEQEKLRCNLCGEVFTAAAPEGVGEEKYDETAGSMVGLLKYGAGLPFNRIERLERGMGIPLPAATQWEIFTGRNHAGENLEKVLKERAEGLGPPIQMCDLLSSNTAGDFETIVAGCMAHSRRKYVEVANNFPEPVKHVLEELKKVYKNDATAKKEGMSPEERLAFHQAESGPVMKDLEAWLDEQIKEKKVEPNSSLGEAIDFMQRHWEKLTRFLHVPGAPLDNNIVERALKKAILHRKNAYFYKTENGARVGDMFMTLIHTAELNGVDPFFYLVALQRHAKEVAENPAEWMPWNYKETMSRLGLAPHPPP
jgi:hypothetical protein